MYRFFASHKKTFFAVAFLVLFGATVSFATPDANTLDPNCAPTDSGCFPIISGGGVATWGTITGTLSDNTALQNALNAKQAVLVSGTSIKTINSSSLLGSGNINTEVPLTFSGNVKRTSNDISLSLDNNTNFVVGGGSVLGINNVFIGNQAGFGVNTPQNGVFIGRQAGYQATNAFSATFLGVFAGYQATNAQGSIFSGDSAGYQATNASYSNFSGEAAGAGATNASYSNLFGYHAGYTYGGNNIGSNNIIIGTNISLPNATANAINLGGVLFGTGTYSTTNGNPSVAPVSGGRIGIGIVSPNHTLDVNGNIGLAPSSYINFSSTDGSSGYGIRDNNGTIEIKNNNGSWQVPFIGSGTLGQIAFWNGTTTQTSSSNLLWDNTNHALTVKNSTANPIGAVRITGTQIQFDAGANVSQGFFQYDTDAASLQTTSCVTCSGRSFTYLDSTGRFGIGTSSPSHYLDVVGNIGISANGYLNFGGAGNVDGVNGYGIRDNGGTIQYKNLGGSWTSFSSGGGSVAIGSAVGSGVNKNILFIDSSGNLAQDDGFQYDTDTKSFTFGNVPSGSIITNGTGSLAFGVANGGQIRTDSSASLAFGTVDNIVSSQIYTGGDNSFAFGSVVGGASLYTDGGGAFTSGYAGGDDGNGTFSYIRSTTSATAHGYASGGAYINAAGQASLIHGTADGSDGNSNVSYLFAGESAQVFGTVFSGAYMSASDRSLVFGTAQGADVNGNLSYITTGSDAGLAWGTAFNGGYINTSGSASQTFGYSDGADINGNVSYLQTEGSGSFTFGNATSAGHISTTGDGSFGYGLVNDSGSILAAGIGSTAGGVSIANGLITTAAQGQGAFAYGYVDSGAINAGADGVLVGGYAAGGYAISSTGRGSFVFGDATDGDIINAGMGSIVVGGILENNSNYGGVFGQYGLVDINSDNSFLFALGGSTTTLNTPNTFAVGYDGGIVFKADSSGVTANTLGVGGILSATLPSGSFGTIASFGANGGAGLINIGYEDGSGISSITGSSFGPFQVASSANNNILISPGSGNVVITNLVGSGSRMVVVDSDGVLSTQAVPGGLSLDGNNSLIVGGGASGVSNSNFFGASAGANATNASNSNFFGNSAGASSASADLSNFFGLQAGVNATNAFRSNFFGASAGANAANASYSNFFGSGAGASATNASNSNFFGQAAGVNAVNAARSNLFGFQAGMTFINNNIGSNNIIIGTNISLPDATANAINIGGILFGTGTYSDINTNPSITAVTSGKIGIAKVTPAYTLDVGNSSISGIVAQFTNSTGVCTINPTSSSVGCTSDIRLKKNITTLGDGSSFTLTTLQTNTTDNTLQKLSLLTPVLYNWNTESDTDQKHTGFIAQQVEQIFPDLVATDQTTGYKTLNYMGFAPYTVKAIQELDIKIDTIIPEAVDTTAYGKIKEFLRGIAAESKAVIDIVIAKKVQTQELCIGDTADSVCVTREQLRSLLQYANSQSTSAPEVPAPAPIADPIEIAPIPASADEAPAVDPLVDLAPEPAN